MEKIKINDVIVDQDIYPRQTKSQITISAYAESLKIGAEFPPIEVQKILTDEEEQTILLDGLHRLEAYEKAKIKEINVIFWKEETIDKKENINDLRLRAGFLNVQHGDRLSHEDMKYTARRIAEDDPEKKYTEEKIAEQFGVTQATVNGWISDIRARQKASRNNLIYRLSLLGWKQDEIAEKTELTQPRIKQIINNISTYKIYNSLSEWIEKGKTIEQAAEKLEIDQTVAWTIHLKDETDDNKKLESLEIKPKKYTSWNFSSCNPLMGLDTFQGRIPGEYPLNFIYWFTKQGDLVVDPMAGGGITLDACLLLNRKCRSYDINPVRKEIEKHDITEGYPKLKKVKAIFCDPPYWSSTDYGDGLSSLSLEEYYIEMENFIKNSYDLLEKDGILGIMIANQSSRISIKEGRLPENFGHRIEHILKIYQLCIDVNFNPQWRIMCPLSTQNANDWAAGEWELGRLGEINRELLIFKK